eukprot:scaffold7307_cov125-Isochrysis_galbana.AAC.8
MICRWLCAPTHPLRTGRYSFALGSAASASASRSAEGAQCLPLGCIAQYRLRSAATRARPPGRPWRAQCMGPPSRRGKP